MTGSQSERATLTVFDRQTSKGYVRRLLMGCQSSPEYPAGQGSYSPEYGRKGGRAEVEDGDWARDEYRQDSPFHNPPLNSGGCATALSGTRRGPVKSVRVL